MNYEIKSISPLSILFNGLRIFVVVGFLVSLITFFIYPNPTLRITGFGQKILATLIFTAVYTIVVSAVLSLITLLYNFWSSKFKGITIHLEQDQ